MIPYSSISQVKYKIDSDTIIGFTPKQTRKLAIKLKEGEKYKNLYFTNEEIIKYKDSVIHTQNHTILMCDSLLVVHNSKLIDYDNKVISYEEDIKKERKKKRQWAWTAIGSIVLNALLIVGIVSK